MDKEAERIMKELESAGIGPDEEFKFHCTQCGKCCMHRDIILNPRDVYNLSKELRITPDELAKQYCEPYIRDSPRMPVIRLKPRGSVRSCPLLKNRKCQVHNSKPEICAMFPIGRYMMAEEGTAADTGAGRIRYIFNNVNCGDDSETHTVREWLNSFGIPVEDDFFMKWQKTAIELAKIHAKMENTISGETMEMVWTAVLLEVYLKYKTDEDFMPQFEENVRDTFSLLHEITEKIGGNDNGNENDSI